MQPYFDTQQILNGGNLLLDELFNSINSAPLALRTSTADRFFDRVFTRNPLDPACSDLLQELKTAFITQACQSNHFYCQPNHPLRELFDCLILRAGTWYPRETKLSQQFLEKLQEIVHLAAGLPHSATRFTSALEEFIHWDSAEEKRAAMLEARLCESELNYLKILTAECRVLDLINEALTGSKLPLAFIEAIPHTLKTELQHCAITAGIEAPFWRLWQRLLPLIAEVFNSDSGDNSDTPGQQLYHHIPLMLHELERSLAMAIASPGQYRQLVDKLSQILLQTIRRQLPELEVMEMLPYPAGHSDTRTRATDSVLQQGADLQQGDWFLFSADAEQLIRCKLALKNATTDQLLFVDRSGRKVMIKSSKDFSLCLSTGIAKHLSSTPIGEMIAELVQALVTLHSSNALQQPHRPLATQQARQPQTKPSQHLAQQQQLAAEQQRTEQHIREEQQRRALAFAEKRRTAAEKALTEAKALAAEKTARAVAAAVAEKDQEAQQANRETLQLHRQLLAQQQLSALNVGAWIERVDQQQQKQRCKLAVLIASAGKYIFVDNLGRKVAEYQRENLLEAFLLEQISIINNGDKFEDQLVKVIRSLRKDVS